MNEQCSDKGIKLCPERSIKVFKLLLGPAWLFEGFMNIQSLAMIIDGSSWVHDSFWAVKTGWTAWRMEMDVMVLDEAPIFQGYRPRDLVEKRKGKN